MARQGGGGGGAHFSFLTKTQFPSPPTRPIHPRHRADSRGCHKSSRSPSKMTKWHSAPTAFFSKTLHSHSVACHTGGLSTQGTASKLKRVSEIKLISIHDGKMALCTYCSSMILKTTMTAGKLLGRPDKKLSIPISE